MPPPRRPLVAYYGILAPHAGRGAALVPAAPSDAQPAGPEAPRSPGRLPWATLLRRVFAIEVLVCPRCAGPRRIVGAVIEPHAVRCLLGALGLAAQAPPFPAPPRDPPSIPTSTPSLRRPSLPADPWEPVLTCVSPFWPLRAGLPPR